MNREGAAYWIPAFAGMTLCLVAATADYKKSYSAFSASGRGIEMTL